MTETQTFTAAQVRLNHGRAEAAVARLNAKAWNGVKYELIAEDGQPAVIVKLVKPYSAPRDAEYEEVLRYQTRIDQTIGHPVSYSNKYNTSNDGSMCKGLDDAQEDRRRKLDAVRSWEDKVSRLRVELAEAEATLAERKAAAGL